MLVPVKGQGAVLKIGRCHECGSLRNLVALYRIVRELSETMATRDKYAIQQCEREKVEKKTFDFSTIKYLLKIVFFVLIPWWDIV